MMARRQAKAREYVPHETALRKFFVLLWPGENPPELTRKQALALTKLTQLIPDLIRTRRLKNHYTKKDKKLAGQIRDELSELGVRGLQNRRTRQKTEVKLVEVKPAIVTDAEGFAKFLVRHRKQAPTSTEVVTGLELPAEIRADPARMAAVLAVLKSSFPDLEDQFGITFSSEKLKQARSEGLPDPARYLGEGQGHVRVEPAIIT